MEHSNKMDGALPGGILPSGMSQAEKDKLEERIMAYFDGALDKASSNRLLSDVSANAEARALFHSHEVLNRVIAAARVPLEAPLEVKRSIVERIPSLVAFIPGLLGTSQMLPVLTQSANPFLAFLSKIPLSTAISIGTSAVVLTTAGVIVKNKLDESAANEARSHVAVVRQHEAPPASAMPYAPLATANTDAAHAPSMNGATPHIATENAASTGSTAAKIARTRVANNRAATSNQSFAVANRAFRADEAANSNNRIQANDSRHSQPVVTRTPSALPEQSKADAPTPPDNTPALTAVAPSSVPAVAANIPVSRPSVISPMPLDFGDGIVLRPFVSSGVGIASWSAGPTLVEGAKHRSAGSKLIQDFRAGFDLAVNDVLSLRFEGGQSQFAHQVLHGDNLSGNGELPTYAIYTAVTLDQAYWTGIGLSYSIAVGQVPLQFSLDGGPVWLHPIGWTAGLGLSTEFDLGSRLALRPGMTFNLTGTGRDGMRNADANPASSIFLNREFNESRMIYSSLGLNIGFMFRF
ncbi:MAG: hypothetical protein Q8922_10865 [Bacteroidota bacterium]|nr:hypothetical protein [Bacteroidota bacterium]MDP4232653.1 hypothetical protein [Bacteroidota bacterium]MDP4243905.1 hypothetical protein [Bacteroidota bacterium]MDP4288426.1 hypothetical protein [Bacteroidota bacterium]